MPSAFRSSDGAGDYNARRSSRRSANAARYLVIAARWSAAVRPWIRLEREKSCGGQMGARPWRSGQARPL